MDANLFRMYPSVKIKAFYAAPHTNAAFSEHACRAFLNVNTRPMLPVQKSDSEHPYGYEDISIVYEANEAPQ